MNKNKHVAIIGLGWLGLPLAESLMEKGISVSGSVSSEEKAKMMRSKGIEAYSLSLDADQVMGETNWLRQASLLVFNIPPKRVLGEDFHPRQVVNFLNTLPFLKNIPWIYISSTSVYGEVEGFVEEKDCVARISPSDHALVRTEAYLENQVHELAVLRCGGLTASDRVIAPYFWKRLSAGQEIADDPINYVHKEDVVNAISLLIEAPKTGTWNLVAPKHPLKSEYTKAWAEKMGIIAEYQSKEHLWHVSKGKWVDGNLIHRELGFKYLYEDPCQFAI